MPSGTLDRERLLDALTAARGEALTIGDLRERGVQMPGQALYELELEGYPVERVRRPAGVRGSGAIGYRLVRRE
jgi:hypothetical protein